jgi:hypothetical protein
MAVNLSPIGNGFQFFTTTGIPLAGGKIYTYQAGSSTPLATYTDNGGVYANTNPIILGSDGRPPSEVWLTNGFNYKFVLKDANDVTIQTYDNLYGIIGTQTIAGTTIPTGIISLWYGATGAVPSGWYLCDGTNGTPDLRDRFIVGAGNNYAVGATGGTANSIVVEHTHTATSTSVVTDAGHDHNTARQNNDQNAWNSVYGTGTAKPGTGIAMSPAGTQTTLETSIETTGITVATTTTNANAGVSGTNANLPPYYALAYVMKA